MSLTNEIMKNNAILRKLIDIAKTQGFLDTLEKEQKFVWDLEKTFQLVKKHYSTEHVNIVKSIYDGVVDIEITMSILINYRIDKLLEFSIWFHYCPKPNFEPSAKLGIKYSHMNEHYDDKTHGTVIGMSVVFDPVSS